MGARGEIIPAPVPWSELPAAAAWLLGHVRTDVPGYQLVGVDGGSTPVASDYHRFDDYIAAINAVGLSVLGENIAIWDPSGKGQFTDGTETGLMDSAPDRLAWIVGTGAEAGFTAFATGLLPRYIPPAGIPLIGATWDRVDKDADRNIIRDLYRRNQGYTWGGADIFQCSLHMHRWSLDAFLTGWCQRGLVTLGGSAKLDDPWSLADPKGAITGYVVGVSQPQWQDKTQTRALVDMAIAVGGA